MSLATGTRLGPYEIQSAIGAGGMGEVYRARDTRLDRDVAIKVLPTAFAQDVERLARFEREAKLLASLNHPSVAQIFYRNGDKMTVVGFSTTPDVVLSAPGVLFEERYAFGAGITIANFDVSRDGQRFIMIKDESGAGRLNVVLNWFSELERLAPAAVR